MQLGGSRDEWQRRWQGPFAGAVYGGVKEQVGSLMAEARRQARLTAAHISPCPSAPDLYYHGGEPGAANLDCPHLMMRH